MAIPKRMAASIAGITIVGAMFVPAAVAATDPGVGPITVSSLELSGADLDAEYLEEGPVSDTAASQQQQDAATGTVLNDESGAVARAELESDIAIVGVTWDPGVAQPTTVGLRVLENGEWSSWQELTLTEPSEDVDASQAGTDPVTLTNVTAVEVAALNADGTPLPDLNVAVIDPRGGDEAENQLLETTPPLPEATPEPEPAPGPEEGAEPQSDDGLLDTDGAFDADAATFGVPTALGLTADGKTFDTGFNGLKITTRKGWGANEKQMTWDPEPVTFQGAVIHHTAGSNNYTQEQVAGQISGIYYYHAVTLGWGDIGYQLVVDKFGGVWEARAGGLTSQTKGAQAYGANSETFGISVLGDYSTTAPSAAAQEAVAKAIAWKFQTLGITGAQVDGTIRIPGSDLKGRTVGVISGHRDVGGSDCPGAAFYARIPSIRTAVKQYLAQETPAPPANPTPTFDAGNVISDAVFYNPNTMTQTQIQTFLDTQGANCKNSGDRTCLKSATFPTARLTTLRGGCQPFTLTGKQSAARIIYATSQACGINPQVLLGTIQKEQSGITQAKTPTEWAKVMGSACPDGKPCDAAQAGFAKQVYYGADKLVSYRINPTWETYMVAFREGRSISIPHNPSAACGAQTVTLKNDATASLYMYTPYIGNSQVAGCSATGARVFFDVMNRWFPGSVGGGDGAAPTPTPTPTPPPPPAPAAQWGTPVQAGTGWPASRTIYPGDMTGDGVGDMMLVDTSGLLWFYQGKATGGYHPRVQIGHGWGSMTAILGGVDWNGDGKNDIIARTRDGRLILYAGNGKGRISTVGQIGHGWSGFAMMTAAQGPNGPAIYATANNQLYLYPGTGKGGFRPRTVFGTGWNSMDALVAVGDWTGDGYPDLLGRTKSGNLNLYSTNKGGTVSTSAQVATGWGSMGSFGAHNQKKPKAPLMVVDSAGKLWRYQFNGFK